jgi:hypothetical protein
MRLYRAVIYGDRYPLEFSTEASSWAVASNRLLKMWMRRFKRSRADTITIRLTRV